jgi:hypothetical protein
MTVYGDVSSNITGTINYYFKVYKYISEGSIVLITTSTPSNDINALNGATGSPTAYYMQATVPETSMNITDRILISLDISSNGAPINTNICTYFENDYYSYIQTSLNDGTNILSSYNTWTGNNTFSITPNVPIPVSDIDSSYAINVCYLNTRLSSYPTNTSVSSTYPNNASISTNYATIASLSSYATTTAYPTNTSVSTNYPTNTSVSTNYPINTSVSTNYPTNTSVSTNYPTNTSVSTNYAKIALYPTNTSVSTNYAKIALYPTNTSVSTNYPTNTSVSTNYAKIALYPTNTSVSTNYATIALYPTNTSVSTNYATIALYPTNTSVITNYPTNTSVSTNYPTNTSVSTNYPTNTSVSTNYPTNTSVSTNYPTNTSVSTNYPTNTSVSTNYATIALYPTNTSVSTNYPTNTSVSTNYPTNTSVSANYATITSVSDNYVTTSSLSNYVSTILQTSNVFTQSNTFTTITATTINADHLTLNQLPTTSNELVSKSYVDSLVGQYSGGLNLYLNYSTTNGIYKELSNKIISHDAESINTQLVTNITYTTIASFITPSAYPGIKVIPSGIWNMTVYGDVSSNSTGIVNYYFKVRKYISASEIITIATSTASNDVNALNGLIGSPTAYYMQATVPETIVNITDRILIELDISSNGAPINTTITTYFENDYYSYIQTSLNDGTNILSAYNTWTGNNDFSVSPSVPTVISNVDSSYPVNVTYLNTRLTNLTSIDNLSAINISNTKLTSSNASITSITTNTIKATSNNSTINLYTDTSGSTINIGGGMYKNTINIKTLGTTNIIGETFIRTQAPSYYTYGAGTINKTTTIGTTEFTDRYYLDSERLSVVSTAIYNNLTNNNNFSNTNEMGIMYINAGQETNFRTNRLLHRSPTTPEIYKVSQFGTNNIVDYYYVDSTQTGTHKASVTVQSYPPQDIKADYMIDAGIISLATTRWLAINAPFIEITGPITPNYAYPVVSSAIGYTNTGTPGAVTVTNDYTEQKASGGISIPAGVWFMSYNCLLPGLNNNIELSIGNVADEYNKVTFLSSIGQFLNISGIIYHSIQTPIYLWGKARVQFTLIQIRVTYTRIA